MAKQPTKASGNPGQKGSRLDFCASTLSLKSQTEIFGVFGVKSRFVIILSRLDRFRYSTVLLLSAISYLKNRL